MVNVNIAEVQNKESRMATLKNAIERFENNAEFERRNNNLQGCLDFRQLAEWLKDYKRLLEQEPKSVCDLCRFDYIDGVCGDCPAMTKAEWERESR